MRLACCFCCYLYVQLLFAQDISGCWEGLLWQGSGAEAETYHFELRIHTSGRDLEGQSFIEQQSLFARYEFKGQLKNEIIYIKEFAVLAEQREKRMDWCTKALYLRWVKTPQGEMLIGSWEGSSEVYGRCRPGRVQLFRKEKDRA